MTGLRSLLKSALAAAVVASPSLALADAGSEVAEALAAGRYADAAAAATGETDADTRASLLSQIAAAQTAGQSTGSRVDRLATETPELNGGSGADFSELIQLIQNQTGGQDAWEAFGGAGTIDSFESGVRVDASGLLERATKRDQTQRLAELRRTVRTADLSDAMQQPASLRIVSLRDLEAAAAEAIDQGNAIPETARRLGGLTRVQYVFVDDGDILLGGPAEGWAYDAAGRAVGTATGAPILNLDDLVVVLRSLDVVNNFGCSIDPRPENIRALRQVVAANSNRRLTPAGTRRSVQQYQDALGRQDIGVHGVPADSRVARVMVEADYRMKLIGAGEFAGTADIPSYFDLVAAHPEHIGGSLRGLRWWLTLDVDAIAADADGRSFELAGCSVRCQSENQLINADGSRTGTGQAQPLNELFAANFTEHYGELAASQMIFADLQGVFDLSLAAALIDREGLDEVAGFDRGVFATGGAYEPRHYAPAREVESVVAYRVYPGGQVVIQAAGGVAVPVAALATDPQLRTVNVRLDSVEKAATDAPREGFIANLR